MTEDEIVAGIAAEAWRRVTTPNPLGTTSDAVYEAIRLARSGWLPEDPLEKEVEAIAAEYAGNLNACIRKALNRGIAIGRGEK